MAPIKLENHIREKLQDREIQTSNGSWEKLQKQLETTPKKKFNKSWMYLAASIVGIIIVSSLILNRNQVSLDPSNNIVESNKEINAHDNNHNDLVSEEEIKSINALENESLKEVPEESNNQLIKKKINTQKIQNEVLASTNTEEPSLTKYEVNDKSIVANKTKKTIDINEEEKFINSKVEEVVAQINDLNKSSKSITEDEINSLLAKAQQEIKTKKLMINNNKVSAIELLSIVEDEMETSFRDRVFEALGDGYKKVRTAVVERNN